MDSSFVRPKARAFMRPGGRWTHFLIAAASGLVISACNTSPDAVFPANGIKIEAASAVASLSPIPEASGFQMPITITNNSMQPIYRPSCGFVVQRSTRGGDEEPLKWTDVWSPACSLALPPGPPLTALQPGRSVTVDVDTRGSGLGPSAPVEGDYRIRFNLFVNAVGSFAKIPDDQSVSTPFKLVIGE